MGSRISSRTELKARVKVRQPKELEAFNSLRLSIVVLAEVLTDILIKVLAEISTEVVAEVEAEIAAGVVTEVTASLVV
jgi:hypothetical protein